MDSALLLWAVAANCVISLSYVALAFWGIPRIQAKNAPPGYLGALVSMSAFLATCGLTHLSLAWHVWTGDAAWMLEPHHMLNHTLQAVAAPVAFTFAALFLRLDISARDRAIDLTVTPKDEGP